MLKFNFSTLIIVPFSPVFDPRTHASCWAPHTAHLAPPPPTARSHLVYRHLHIFFGVISLARPSSRAIKGTTNKPSKSVSVSFDADRLYVCKHTHTTYDRAECMRVLLYPKKNTQTRSPKSWACNPFERSTRIDGRLPVARKRFFSSSSPSV